MAKVLTAVAMLLTMTTQRALADDPTQGSPIQVPDEVAQAAEKAQVDPLKLLGAVNTTKLDPTEYLYMTGELEPPAPVAPTGWPIGGALGSRIYCIEGIESTHGARMGPNPIPVGNEHAQGWLGYLPSTARHWGVQIGNRASEWQGAAAIMAQGERFARTQFYGLGAGLC